VSCRNGVDAGFVGWVHGNVRLQAKPSVRKSNARGSGKGDVSLTNTTGEHAGDSIALDHILPIAVVPELAARFFNLDALPAKENQAKAARIGRRELDLA